MRSDEDNLDAPEYYAYLAENGLDEEDVLPVLRDKSFLGDPDTILLMAQLFAEFKNANHHEREQIKRLAEGFSQNTNWLIRTLDKDFRTRLRRLDVELPANVEIGVFPLNSFNARAVKRGSSSLLLLDTGLIEIIEFVVALTLLDDPPERSARRLIDCLVPYIRNHKHLPSTTDLHHPSWDLEKTDNKKLFYPILTAAELFVLLHEYGHHVLRHISSNRSATIDTGNTFIEVDVHNHIQEFHADMWVLHTLQQAAFTEKDKESHLAIACAAPVFFMGTCALVELLRNEYQTRENRSHPFAVDRLYTLAMMLFDRKMASRDHCFLWWKYEAICDAAYLLLTGREMPIPVFDPNLKIIAEEFSHYLSNEAV